MNCENRIVRGFERSMKLTMLLLIAAIFICAGAVAKAGDAVKENSVDTITTDYGWCVLTCPKTCKPGEPFEVSMDLKVKEISRNWEANKLAVHLFWSGKEKWGGYLGHFGSAEVVKDGVLTLKGKFELDDKIKAEAAFVLVKVWMASEWAATDENKAADLMGPKIEIVKDGTAVQK